MDNWVEDIASAIRWAFWVAIAGVFLVPILTLIIIGLLIFR